MGWARPTPSCCRGSGARCKRKRRTAAASACGPGVQARSKGVIDHAPTSRIGVMHITDTLAAGGTERVAVNVVNNLPREQYRVHLCTTRQDGPLASLVAEDVGRLRLSKSRTIDRKAIQQLVAYV